MPRSRQTLVVLATTSLALAGAASAQAAVTATFDKACYSHLPATGNTPDATTPVVATLTGGTPNGDFILAASVPGGAGEGSAGSVDGTFDPTGSATVSLTDISTPTGTITPTAGGAIDMSVRDYGGADSGSVSQPVGQVTVNVAGLSVAVTPRSPRAHRTVIAAAPVFANQPVYGFVTSGNGRRTLRKIKLGTANACGYVKTRAVAAPPSGHRGHYRFYVNAGSKLNKTAALVFAFKIGSIF